MKPLSPVAISEQLYRHLLIVYPPRFRHVYAREMALVFRSQCRALVQRHGESALVRLWLSTLPDLVSTALVERMKEGFSMSKTMWVQLCAIFSFIGGFLGLYLLTLGPNQYGSQSWDHDLAPVTAILLAAGLTGWFTLYYEQMTMRGWIGIVLSVSGFLGMASSFFVENLWFLIFLGPLLLVPIGGILLALNAARIPAAPTWWRYFPTVIAVIGFLGFAIEIAEQFTHDGIGDRGLMMAELLFSVLWLALSVALWLAPRQAPSQPEAM